MKNNKQSGVALVTVLLVAAVTIALAYGALTVSLNTLQGSKAAESSVQARLNAESGLDATFVYLEERFRANEDFKIFSHIPAIKTENSATMEQGKTYAFPTDPERFSVDDTFHIALDGYTSDGSTYQTNADVYYNPGSNGQIDTEASEERPSTIHDVLYRGVTSCSITDVSGSGQILGARYIFSSDDVILKAGDGLIEANIHTTGKVSVTGGARIEGDVTASKSISVTGGSTTINGVLHSGGSLDMSGSSRVNGDVFIEGDITISGGSTVITGDVFSNGLIKILNDAKIIGNVYARNGVEITGSSRVEGNVYSEGPLTLSGGGRKVIGDVVALGPVEVTGNGTEIAGNFYVPHSITLGQQLKLTGNLYVNGDLTLESWGLEIAGSVYSTGNLILQNQVDIRTNAYIDGKATLSANSGYISGDLYAGVGLATKNEEQRVKGNIYVVQNAGSDPINVLESEINHQFVQLAENFLKENGLRLTREQEFTICNLGSGLSIEQDVETLRLASTGAFNGVSATGGHNKRHWTIEPGTVTETPQSGGSPTSHYIPIENGAFAGQPIRFMHFKSFSVDNDNKIIISGGNVVLLVDEKISITTPSRLSIDQGSSLTIITPSQIVVGTSGGDSSWSVLNNHEKPSLAFYTSYGASPGQTGNGFDMSGGNKTLNALVYSPSSSVVIHSSTLHGAAVGKKVQVTGGGGKIKFNEGLLDLIGGTSTTPSNGEKGLVIVKRR